MIKRKKFFERNFYYCVNELMYLFYYKFFSINIFKLFYIDNYLSLRKYKLLFSIVYFSYYSFNFSK